MTIIIIYVRYNGYNRGAGAVAAAAAAVVSYVRVYGGDGI